jgi:hypothetical protein
MAVRLIVIYAVMCCLEWLPDLQAADTVQQSEGRTIAVPSTLPEQARFVTKMDGVAAYSVPWEKSDQPRAYYDLFLVPEGAIQNRTFSIPRLANSVGSVYLQSAPEPAAVLRSEPDHWVIELPEIPKENNPVVVLRLNQPLLLMSDKHQDIPDASGIIRLPARHAMTYGKNLRYEPQSHKNTVGYWSNKDDYAAWSFRTTSAGSFDVYILQGCGKGHGGSEVSVVVGEESVTFRVEETGHFQNFIWRTIGTVSLASETDMTLKLIPVSKPGGAVMDVREVRLVPAGLSRMPFKPELADPNAFPEELRRQTQDPR